MAVPFESLMVEGRKISEYERCMKSDHYYFKTPDGMLLERQRVRDSDFTMHGRPATYEWYLYSGSRFVYSLPPEAWEEPFTCTFNQLKRVPKSELKEEMFLASI